MGARRDRSWVLVVLTATALVVTVAGLLAAAGAWPRWVALLPVLIAAAIVGAARGVPPGATRDFLTWLALGAWLIWAAWWLVMGRSA